MPCAALAMESSGRSLVPLMVDGDGLGLAPAGLGVGDVDGEVSVTVWPRARLLTALPSAPASPGFLLLSVYS